MSKHHEKYGFVYIWYDRKHKRYYVGCHWGTVDDGYICSSSWMNKSFKNRPQDFKRRILKTNIPSRQEMFEEELRYLQMIKPSEIKPTNPKPRYYNLRITLNTHWLYDPEKIKTVGQKISAAKKGKNTGPRSPEVGAKISAAKKAAAEKRRQLYDGYSQPPEIRKKYALNSKRVQSIEERSKRSESMKKAWANGDRKRASPKVIMSKEEQTAMHSLRMKNLWNDPIWAEKQGKLISEGKS